MNAILKWNGNPITEPGLYDLPASAYYGGDVLPPNLGQSEAKVLLEDGGPARFQAATGNRVEKREWDLGTTAHALILGKGIERIQVLDFPNYLTKAAKEAREVAYAKGLTPMLAKDFALAEAMADAVPLSIKALFTGGAPEVSMLWRHESGLWLRGQADYLSDCLIDLKTTDDASTYGFARSVHKYAYHLQAAWYRRGVEALTGERLPYLIVAVEKKAPHLTRVFELTEDYLAVGEAAMDRAIATYLACVESDTWPGYAPTVEPLDPPHWLAQESADAQIAEIAALIGEQA